MIEKIKNKCLEYIEEHLVNSFLKTVNASSRVVLAVNTLMSFDGAYILRTLLSYYGLARFLDAVFVLSLFM
jgi:hypothetical protein